MFIIINKYSNSNTKKAESDEMALSILLSTEYIALNDWRISKLTRQDQWGAILFPASIAIFTGAVTFGSGKYGLIILGLLASGIVLLLWRWNDHNIDETIRKHAYPRLVELEEALGYHSLREWLKSAWWPTQPPAWLPTRADIEAKNLEFQSHSLLTRFRYIGAGRPLFRWDNIAFYLWVLEFIIVLVIITAKLQGSTWINFFF